MIIISFNYCIWHKKKIDTNQKKTVGFAVINRLVGQWNQWTKWTKSELRDDWNRSDSNIFPCKKGIF